MAAPATRVTTFRGRLFDQIADLYDEVRPVYPPGFYVAIESVTGPLQGRDVLDLGAGPGVVTRTLLDRGAPVVALDPGEPMLRQLVRRTPTARAVVGKGERMPLRDDSFDLVTCATAWHWLDADRAVGEVRRVVRPGGHLALFWANHVIEDRIDWEHAQAEVYRRSAVRAGSRPPDIAGVGPRQAARHLRRHGLTVLVDTELRWTRRVTTDVHLNVLATHSDVLALGERRHEFLGELAAALQPWPEVDERLWGPLVVARLG